MAEVTCQVTLPAVTSDDGVAAGEPTEGFNPVADVMPANALSRRQGRAAAVAFEAAEGFALPRRKNSKRPWFAACIPTE